MGISLFVNSLLVACVVIDQSCCSSSSPCSQYAFSVYAKNTDLNWIYKKPHLPYFGMTWKGLARIVSSWGRMLAKYCWLLFRTFASTQKMMSRIITEDNTTKEIQIWRIAVLAGAHRCFTNIDNVLVTNEQLRRPVIVGKTSKMFCEAVMHHIQQKKNFRKLKNYSGKYKYEK